MTENIAQALMESPRMRAIVDVVAASDGHERGAEGDGQQDEREPDDHHEEYR